MQGTVIACSIDPLAVSNRQTLLVPHPATMVSFSLSAIEVTLKIQGIENETIIKKAKNAKRPSDY